VQFDSVGNLPMYWHERRRAGSGQDPRDMAIDDNGDIFVIDRRYDRIQHFDHDMNRINSWGTRGEGRRSSTRAVADNLYVIADGDLNCEQVRLLRNLQAIWTGSGEHTLIELRPRRRQTQRLGGLFRRSHLAIQVRPTAVRPRPGAR
jgi:hypothetical protein